MSEGTPARRTRRDQAGVRHRQPPDAGVTVIVGLILAAGLLAALLVNYQLKWVPLAEEEHQAEHMDRVNQQMGALLATLDKQLLGQVNTSVSSPVHVGVPGKSFPSMAPVSHSLTFESASDGGHGVTINASEMRLVERDGRWLVGLDERWTAIPSTNGSIEDVHHLRLRIDPVEPAASDRSVQVQITNATGAQAGWFSFTVEAKQSDGYYNVTTETRTSDENGSVIAQDRRMMRGTVGTYHVDVLDKAHQFDALLKAAEAPFTLTFTTTGLDADQTLTYDRLTSRGTIVSAAGGRTLADHSIELPSATITYDGDNPNFVDQSYVIENGALLVSQHDGTAFLAEPRLDADLLDDNVVLSLTMPQIQTRSQQLAGNTDVTVKTTTQQTHSQRGWSPDLTIRFDTAHPSAWAELVTDQLTDAGVGTTYFSVSTTSSSVTLTVTGNPTNGSGTDDVYLTLHHTLIRAEALR